MWVHLQWLKITCSDLLLMKWEQTWLRLTKKGYRMQKWWHIYRMLSFWFCCTKFHNDWHHRRVQIHCLRCDRYYFYVRVSRASSARTASRCSGAIAWGDRQHASRQRFHSIRWTFCFALPRCYLQGNFARVSMHACSIAPIADGPHDFQTHSRRHSIQRVSFHLNFAFSPRSNHRVF